jgi:hypothetical protein
LVQNNHNFNVQFIGDPLLRTQVDPILALSGSWQIGKKDFQTERGNNTTIKYAILHMDSSFGMLDDFNGFGLMAFLPLVSGFFYLDLLTYF